MRKQELKKNQPIFLKNVHTADPKEAIASKQYWPYNYKLTHMGNEHIEDTLYMHNDCPRCVYRRTG